MSFWSVSFCCCCLLYFERSFANAFSFGHEEVGWAGWVDFYFMHKFCVFYCWFLNGVWKAARIEEKFFCDVFFVMYLLLVSALVKLRYSSSFCLAFFFFDYYLSPVIAFLFFFEVGEMFSRSFFLLFWGKCFSFTYKS